MKVELLLNPMRDVDHLVRNIVPGFIDAVGLPKESAKMRSLAPLTGGAASILSARHFLQSLARTAHGRWSVFIEDLAFWMEAAIVTAQDGAFADCRTCVWIVKRELDSYGSQFVEH